ncbi:SH3 domain-containing protein [Aphelenchoides fujianensis]|nr:SH3 domain-containing protein [Aphelenchoides fujianensis]
MEDQINLQQLYSTEVAEDIGGLSVLTGHLERQAAMCEHRYKEGPNQPSLMFEETKQYTLQSLADVAGNISEIAKKLWSSLEIEAANVNANDSNVRGLNMMLAISREKTARRDIGRLTAERQGLKENTVKITSPPTMEKAPRYQRYAIDYNVLDHLGHGTPPPEQNTIRLNVNRTHSVVSGDSMEYTASRVNSSSNTVYERFLPTQTPHGMYSQDTIRTVKDQYGVPQIYGNYYNSYSTLRRNPSQVNGNGSHYGGSMIYMSSGISQNTRASSVCNQSEGSQQNGYSEEEPLPSPPAQQLSAEHYVPPSYLCKARVLFDYDGAKEDELNLQAGDIVYVLRKNEDGWYEGKII